MIIANQMRTARVLLGLDQRAVGKLPGLPLSAIPRMEASDGVIRDDVGSLMKPLDALQLAGVERIGNRVPSTTGGRGVHPSRPASVSSSQ